MSLHIYPPGRRSKNWHLRGTYLGIKVDQSTFKRHKDEAETFREEVEASIRDAENRKNIKTFSEAAMAYIAWRKPKRHDEERINGISALIGHRPIDTIGQNDIIEVAEAIFKDRNVVNATKNRCVFVPMAAVHHYAANNQWCEWRRLRKFKEPRPKTRFVTDDVETKLLEATKDNEARHALILWLFRQGDRIGDTLRVAFEKCDFKKRTVEMHISKIDTYVTKPLHDDVIEALKRLQKKRNCIAGPVFTWGSRQNVYRWLRPLTKRLQIQFSPHMARHTLGKRLSDQGAPMRVAMDMLCHRDIRSTVRYQAADIETIRRFSDLALGGKSGSK